MKIINADLLKDKIDNTVKADIKAEKVGAVSICVFQNGKEVYRGHFANKKAGFTANDKTIYRLASMTKPVTAVAVLILVDRGLINLDDKISKYIPGFESMKLGSIDNGKIEFTGAAHTPITIRHLLSHTSGLGGWEASWVYLSQLPVEERTSLAKVVDYYTNCPLDFEPFSREAYSAIHAFDVLARIVEIVSDKAYDKFLQEEILEPLGMEDTTFAPDKEQLSRMTPVHGYSDGKAYIHSYPDGTVFEGFPVTYFCGGAGLASTISDYEKFVLFLLNKGSVNNRQLVSENLIEEMAKAQIPASIMPGNNNWGLGVRVISDKSYKYLPVGTFGWSGAYGTHFWVDPENKITAIYMKNSCYDGGAGASTAAAFEKDVNSAL